MYATNHKNVLNVCKPYKYPLTGITWFIGIIKKKGIFKLVGEPKSLKSVDFRVT